MYNGASLFLLLTLSTWVLSAIAGPTINDYGSLPTTSHMSLSPDGNTVAFRRVEDGKDSLIVYSLAKKKLIRAVDVSAVMPDDIFFIANNQVIIRASERKKLPGFKGYHRVSTAFALNTTTGQLEQLLRPGDNVYLGQTDLSRIVGASKDKEFVYMPALVVQRDGRSFGGNVNQGSYSEKLDYSLMKVDLGSPNRPATTGSGDRDAIDFFIDKKGDVLAEERYEEYSNLHEILVKRGSKWDTIYSEKVKVRTIDPVGLAPDYKSLAVLAYGKNGRRQYYSMSLEDGSLTLSDVNSDNHDIENLVLDNNRIAYGVRYRGFLPSYKFFNERLDKRVNKLIERFSGNSVAIESWSGDWKKILVYVAGSSFSGEYYLFDEHLNAQFISDSRPTIKNEDVNPIAIVNATTSDNLKIPTLLTIPKAKLSAMKNLPAVVLPHGGPRANDNIEFDWIAQALASQGYIVIQPQYRGSTGFGWSFIEAGYGEWGGKMLDDINAALDFTIMKGIVDKSKVCIVGASYGGYAALENGAKTPNKYRCIVSINGIGDMWDMMKIDRSKFGKYSSWLQVLNDYVDDGGADKDAYKAISPYYKAEDFKAPVLLIHGEHDERVGIDQSKNMAASLKRAKKKVTYIKLKGETHYLEQNSTRLTTLNSVVDFVNTNMK